MSPSDSRRREIKEATYALRDLSWEVDRAFSRTHWGEDNGCKALLLRVREEASRHDRIEDSAMSGSGDSDQ